MGYIGFLGFRDPRLRAHIKGPHVTVLRLLLASCSEL